MGTRVSYPAEVKMKAIEMKLSGIPAKQIMDELNIKNVSQLKTWMKWYKTGEIHRLNKAAEIATGAPNPAAPSKKAPNENAINYA